MVPPSHKWALSEPYQMAAGSIVGVFGPNGSGKSTYLNLLVSDALSKREVLFKSNIKPAIGIVPQDLRSLLPPWLTPRCVHDIFARDLSDRKLEFSESDYPLDIRLSKLSGGQKQSFAIDLMLSIRFDLLLLDEPFSAMDITRSNKYAVRIKEYCRRNNCNAMIVLHDPLKLQFLSSHFLLFNPARQEAIIHPNKGILCESDLMSMRFDSAIHSECMQKVSFE